MKTQMSFVSLMQESPLSVTFTVPGANPEFDRSVVLACPKCGASTAGASGDQRCNYDDGGGPCDGYGPTPPWVRPENLEYSLNVSRASVILYGLLNYGSSEKPLDGGELDPSDVLIRLALADFRISTLISPPTYDSGERIVITDDGVSIVKTAQVHNGGMTQDRLERYVETLTKFAHKAIELGEMIHYA